MARRASIRRGSEWSVLGVALALPSLAHAQASVTPTYAKDVAPIFREKCEACHRPGYIAPMSLQTYTESRPWARSIKNRVEARQMPPWHIDKTVGIQSFQNDRSLTNAEIDTIARWVDGGAPQGSPADMPAPAVFTDDDVWNFADRFGGPPDLVVRSTPHTMPALSQDHWWKPVVPTGLTEDRWIRAIEIRPATVEGRRVTHHALAQLLQEEDDPETLRQATGLAAGLLMEWAVGKEGEIMRDGSGKLIKAGSSIVFDIHYSAAGEEVSDFVELKRIALVRSTRAWYSCGTGGSYGRVLDGSTTPGAARCGRGVTVGRTRREVLRQSRVGRSAEAASTRNRRGGAPQANPLAPADPPRPAHGAGGPDPRAAGSHAGRITGGPAHAGESPHAVPHDQTARLPV